MKKEDYNKCGSEAVKCGDGVVNFVIIQKCGARSAYQMSNYFPRLRLRNPHLIPNPDPHSGPAASPPAPSPSSFSWILPLGTK